MIRARQHAIDIGQRQCALRLVEGRLFGVALEELGNIALAGCDDDKFGFLRIGFKIVDAGVMDGDGAAAALEFRHPARDLHPLVDALTRLVEFAVPVDCLVAGAIGRRDDEIDRVDGGAGIVPEVQPDVALVLQCRVEHALARQNLARPDLLGRAVLDDIDLVALGQQAAAELEAGLAAPDDCYFA